MTRLVEKTKSQRKTFTIPNYIVKELEEYSITHDTKQSQIIALALEDFLHKKNSDDAVEKRINAFNSLIAIAPKGSLGDLDVKEMLNEKALKDA